MSVTSLSTKDPFADDGGVGSEGRVDVRIQQRSGRKALTTITGLPKNLNFEQIVKAFKKNFACNGNLVVSEEFGTVVQLQGDQRKNIVDFLTSEDIVKRQNIVVHGY